MKTKDQVWEYLVESGIATESELQLITTINGYNIESLNAVLYARTAWRSVEQLEEMEAEA